VPILKNNKNPHFFTPFGPTMGYFKMPSEMVEFLNKNMDKGLKDNSENLVGKVTQELRFDTDIKNYAAEKLLEFIVDYHQFTKNRNSMGQENLDKNKSPQLDIVSGWFVRQFENEYNPVHYHHGCTLSCVGYLKLPDGIDEEWEQDYKDHYPANGHINFLYGSSSAYSCSNFLIKPKVGDFYIFPSDLFHAVYPFYTIGERRSFSMNMIFSMV
jgi:hypothetical protein